MKKHIILIFTIGLILSCKAQSPIIPLFNNPNYLETNNAYYKDLDGDLTKLVGAWEYANGNELFRIEFSKKSQNQTDFSDITCYEDLLYGNYKYQDNNGVVLVNTLGNMHNDVYDYPIIGNYILPNNYRPACNSCGINDRRLKLNMEDPQRLYFSYSIIILHHFGDEFSNIPESISVRIFNEGSTYPEGQPSNDRLPLVNEYVLLKVD